LKVHLEFINPGNNIHQGRRSRRISHFFYW